MRIDTGAGPAQVEFDGRGTRFVLALTHGAGGDADTGDLLAVSAAALAAGGTVARIRQPYRVAGRRAPGSATKQDQAWLEVIAALRAAADGVPLIQGGRSNGARVACRTAVAAGAVGVVALSFPLHPPGKPENTRVDELRSAPNVLVINGERDPFGIPDPADAGQLHIVARQAHSFRAGFEEIRTVTSAWLDQQLP